MNLSLFRLSLLIPLFIRLLARTFPATLRSQIRLHGMYFGRGFAFSPVRSHDTAFVGELHLMKRFLYINRSG
ncbi:MAG: hypothetical protein HYR77_11885 [Ignavibacteria bacterium]|nr:hypothetical protein [Ignavibacteria bacterium]